MKIFIECEFGSNRKNRYNEKTLELENSVDLLLPYPYPYGFITNTITTDGEGVDCYVITKDRLVAGTILECEPIGLLEQFEDGEIDHKVLAILPSQNVKVTKDLLNELRGFIYAIFSQFPEMNVRVERILPKQAAIDHIQKSQRE